MAKKAIFYFIMFAFLFLLFEAFAYVTPFFFDEIYDHRAGVLERVEGHALAGLKKDRVDPVLGWKYSGPKVTSDCNCQGTEIAYTFDHLGTRTYRGYDGKAAEVIVVGDSYSHGSEVGDEETFSAQLAHILGVSVANHSVGGYGPVQAFLNLKQKLPHYPRARFAVLGIMYENIFRMVNSYRPVLADKSSPYSMKPYIQGGEIRPLPWPDAFENVDAFIEQANQAFDHDFWTKPKHRFPFSISYMRALGSNFFYFKKLPRKLRKIGLPEYFLSYRSRAFSGELLSLLDQYTAFLSANNIGAVVVFIPRDRFDTRSVSKFIEKNREGFPPALLIADVGTMDVDWERYNLLDASDEDNVNICHPSPYGHGMIAECLADLLLRGGSQRARETEQTRGNESRK